MPSQLESRSLLLRWWRAQHPDVTLEALARAIGAESPSTISNWESGARIAGPNIDQVMALDARFKAGGCFEGIYAALRTPDALEPAREWWHNFQGESRPCWAWVRVAGPHQARAYVDAGPFRLELDVPADGGVFLQAYAFAHNPAVHVDIDSPGWTDFGYGEVPDDIGVPIIDAARFAIVGPRGSRDPALMTARSLWRPHKFGPQAGWFEEVKKTLGDRVEVARHVLSAALKAPLSTRSDVSNVNASRDDVPRHWGGARYEKLRQARGLSLNDLALLASRQAELLPPITRDHVHRLEHGSTPRVTDLVERLDMALRADGRTCTAQVYQLVETPAGVEISFPSYWIGPVWIQFLAAPPVEENRARLVWPPWHKGLLLRDGVVVTCRRAEQSSAPLRVEHAPGWTVRAGVGVHPRAIDINDGWGLVDTNAALETLTYYYKILEQALRHTLGRRDGARP